MGKISVRRYEDYYAIYDTKYMAEVSHNGLVTSKIVYDRDPDILENKIQAQIERFTTKWNKEVERREKEDLKEQAEDLNHELGVILEQIQGALRHTLEVDDTVDWDQLKDFSTFTKALPKKPKNKTLPQAPNKDHPVYNPALSFLDKIFKARAQKKLDDARRLLAEEVEKYESKRKQVLKYNEGLNIDYQAKLEKWNASKRNFEEKQAAANAKVDELKSAYLSKDRSSVENYCELVLNNSEYPDVFPKSFELEYDPASRSLIVEYQLPTPEHIPTVKEYKFISSKKEIKEVVRPQSQINNLYDSLIYQISLRTIHELFEADQADALDLITFNGWVDFINKSNGKQEHSCIVSLQTRKEEFEDINLALVDPKQCFKSLKGVGSSKLYGLAPVKPILIIEKNDSRIRDSYDVADTIDDSMNLAEMDWEDFEHLVRELFAKEFSVNGGEVHVTQASRDGGVDAIAFDPDPIRGGKIVIQAKRYSNTVGVSAVRDLFGTIVNEGANKGILVTTANYGPDAYEFAKSKPITLMSGANLLHLLSKHGYTAKIDLQQARFNRQSE